MPLSSGTRLGRYRVESLLGAGGMGEVYRAHDSTLRRSVALKILPQELTLDRRRVRRFEQEARAASALTHPHILTVYDIGTASPEGTSEGPLHYISMELVEGETLRESFRRGAPLRKRLGWLAQVAEGLVKAHEAGVVHRDLKPENIMISADGYAKILDFGLAKLVEGRRSAADVDPDAETETRVKTGTGMIVGTLGYMSPEQVEAKKLDHRSDIFALGCILYEAIASRRAFEGESFADTLYKIVHQEPKPIEHWGEAPSELAYVLAKCLAKDPSERFQSTRDLALDLKNVLRATESSSRPAIANPPGSAPRSWRSRIAAAVVVLLGTGLLLWQLSSGERRSGSDGSSRLLGGDGTGPSEPRHRQVTFDGTVGVAALSPDGRSVAYSSFQGTERRLKVRDLDGGTLDIWQGQFVGEIHWRPDGSHVLAFVANRPDGSDGRLVMIPQLGGEARRLTGGGGHFTLSPDQRWLARAFRNQLGFTLVPLETGEETEVTLSGFERLRGLAWSPSGQRISVLTRSDDHTWAVWTVTPEGKEQQQIYETKHWITSICFSPLADVLYAVERDGLASKVLRLTSKRGAPAAVQVVLSGLPALGSTCSVSADGRRLALLKISSRANLQQIGLGQSRSADRALTQGTSTYFAVELSPDGETVVAEVYPREEEPRIVRMPVAGGEPVEITSGYSPAISPDGARLAFVSARGGTARVWTCDLQGGALLELEGSDVGSNHLVTWLPDGRLAWQLPQARDWRIRDLDTGADETLVEDPSVGHVFDPKFSPKGDRVAVYWNRTSGEPDGLWLIDLEDRGERFVARDTSPLRWSRDGEWIYANPPEGNTVVRISVRDGRTENIGEAPEGTSECQISPDEESMICVVGESTSDVWLVEDFDPSIAAP